MSSIYFAIQFQELERVGGREFFLERGRWKRLGEGRKRKERKMWGTFYPRKTGAQSSSGLMFKIGERVLKNVHWFI